MALSSSADRIRFAVNPAYVLSGVAIWSYYFFKSSLGFGIMGPIVALFVVACLYAYAKNVMWVSLARKSLWVGLGFLVLNFLFHSYGIFFCLGGDELYHAERAVFPLMKLAKAVGGWPALSLQDYRSSMWHLFDLRFWAVIDIWRHFSFLFWGLILVLTLLWSRRPKIKTLSLRIIFVGLALWVLFSIGRDVAGPLEPHPPFRLFFPFLSATVFGLNSFAFRFAGIFSLSLIQLGLFEYLRHSRKVEALWAGFFVLMMGFIPTVFYTAEALEASIYGFGIWMALLVLALRFLEERESSLLQWAGLILGVGTLMRQSTMILWPLVGVLWLQLPKKQKTFAQGLRVFLPGLLVLPFLYTVKVLGHGALGDELGTGSKLLMSLSEGIGPMTILNSTGIIWVVLALFAFLNSVKGLGRVKGLWLFCLFPLAYAFFHVIRIFLWGLGRYQVEYVAPFVCLALLLAIPTWKGAKRLALSAILFLAALSTLELNTNLSLDTNYSKWPQMRVSSTASFNYREALGYLKRSEIGGHFAILGGSPWYGETALWLSGHNFSEAAIWRKGQNKVGQLLERQPTGEQFLLQVRALGIKKLVVQSGTRREGQHRIESVARAIDFVSKESGLSLERSFGGEHGGILDIYSLQ